MNESIWLKTVYKPFERYVIVTLTMAIIVYWLEQADDGWTPYCEEFSGDQLTQTLARAEALRKLGHRHVSISTELDEHVGAAGVSSVEAGKTPDGHHYEWSKAGRAGKMRRR